MNNNCSRILDNSEPRGTCNKYFESYSKFYKFYIKTYLEIPGVWDSVGEILCCATDRLQSLNFKGRISSPLRPVDSKTKKSDLTNFM